MNIQAVKMLAQERLSALPLAEMLGNVRAACRQCGRTRTQFYDYKRCFELKGLEGLKDLPTIYQSHPQTTPDCQGRRRTDPLVTREADPLAERQRGQSSSSPDVVTPAPTESDPPRARVGARLRLAFLWPGQGSGPSGRRDRLREPSRFHAVALAIDGNHFRMVQQPVQQ